MDPESAGAEALPRGKGGTSTPRSPLPQQQVAAHISLRRPAPHVTTDCGQQSSPGLPAPRHGGHQVSSQG